MENVEHQRSERGCGRWLRQKRNMQFDYSTGSRQQSKYSIVNNLMETSHLFSCLNVRPHHYRIHDQQKNSPWKFNKEGMLKSASNIIYESINSSFSRKNWIFHEFRVEQQQQREKKWPDIRSSSSPRGECLTRLFLELQWSEQQQPERQQCTTDFERWEWNIC